MPSPRIQDVFAENVALRREAEKLFNDFQRARDTAEHRAVRIKELEQQVAELEDQLEGARKRIEQLARQPAEKPTVSWHTSPYTSSPQHTLAPSAQYLQIHLLEGTTKSVNALHSVGQVVGRFGLSRKDTRNIGIWLMNSVEEAE